MSPSSCRDHIAIKLRAIYRYKVVAVKAGQPVKNHSVAVRGSDGNLKKRPNLHYYL